METVLSTATLAALIWAVLFLVPKAAKEDDRFALVCAVLTLMLALVLWFLVGAVRVV